MHTEIGTVLDKSFLEVGYPLFGWTVIDKISVMESAAHKTADQTIPFLFGLIEAGNMSAPVATGITVSQLHGREAGRVIAHLQLLDKVVFNCGKSKKGVKMHIK
jgi:hypothetical protein